MLSSPFRIHPILKLAPVLVRTFCSSTTKTSTVTPIFYFMILMRTVLPFSGGKLTKTFCSVFFGQFYRMVWIEL